jgi:Acyl-CoA carboxylase epsilon subunit
MDATVPFLSVVRGNPSAEEIAAVVAVLAARARSAGEPGVDAPVRSEWSARSALMRPAARAGPGQWRASALPR